MDIQARVKQYTLIRTNPTYREYISEQSPQRLMRTHGLSLTEAKKLKRSAESYMYADRENNG